jgi:signal transduction histidine kinase
MKSRTLQAAQDPGGGVAAGTECISVQHLESFLRQLSHDVRNDLNAMELLVSYVEGEGAGGDSQNAIRQLHEAVRYGARRMVRVSKAVQFPDLEHIPYPADILQEDLKARLLAERPDLAVRVVWEPCSTQAVALLDAGLVMEALTELLDNAVAFSVGDAPVHIGVEACEVGIRWRIFQHAPECPANFEQWGRLPLVSTRRSHYGLGLFGVRRILRAHRALLGFLYDVEGQRLVTEVVFSAQE